MEVIVKAILLIFEFVLPKVFEGKNKRQIQNRVKALFSVLAFTIISFTVFYVAKTAFYPKKPECSELRSEVDTLKKQNNILTKKIEYLQNKYDNIDLEKYPYNITPQFVAELKKKLIELSDNLGCCNSSISLFHNAPHYGFKPINNKMYCYSSILVSTSNWFINAYDEGQFQNVQLGIYSLYFEKCPDGRIEYYRDNRDNAINLLFKMVLLDQKKATRGYVFGIKNKGNINVYGKFIGVFICDWTNTTDKISDTDKMRIEVFFDDLAYMLEKMRKL